MIEVLNYTKKPLTLMGIVASKCWNSKPNINIAIDCIESGHHRVLEYPDVIVLISGYSARMIRELYTHIIGVTRLQESTRYVEYGDFGYYIPNAIKNNELALDIYKNCMDTIQNSYKALQLINIKKEDIANLLPLGMFTKVVLKINARAILHMAEVRMCNRTLKEYRDFMTELKQTLEHLDEEWRYIAKYMEPKCEKLKYCNEKNSCGKYSN